jgi:hypothetical protein
MRINVATDISRVCKIDFSSLQRRRQTFIGRPYHANDEISIEQIVNKGRRRIFCAMVNCSGCCLNVCVQ